MSLNALMGLHSHIFPRNRILRWHFFLFLYFNCSTVWWLTLFPTGNMLFNLYPFPQKLPSFPRWLLISCALVYSAISPVPHLFCACVHWAYGSVGLPFSSSFENICPLFFFFFWPAISQSIFSVCPILLQGVKKNVSDCFISPHGSPFPLFIGQFLVLCLSVH